MLWLAHVLGAQPVTVAADATTMKEFGGNIKKKKKRKKRARQCHVQILMERTAGSNYKQIKKTVKGYKGSRQEI